LGKRRKKWLSEVYLLNSSNTKWIRIGELPYQYSYRVGSCYNNNITILGGGLPDELANNKSFTLDLNKSTSKWEKSSLPARSVIYPAITQKANILYTFGGLENDGKWQDANSKLAYLDIGDSEYAWRYLEPMPAAGRALASMCEKDGILYVLGGARLNNEGDLINLSEMWSFDLKQQNWKRLPDIPFAVRCSLAFPWKHWIILFVSCLTDVTGKARISDVIYIYNTVDRTWRKFGNAPYFAAVNGIFKGNNIYLIGGEDKPKSRVATCALGTIKMKTR
jgi:N-acetylneuraminic acid mutarotase